MLSTHPQTVYLTPLCVQTQGGARSTLTGRRTTVSAHLGLRSGRWWAPVTYLRRWMVTPVAVGARNGGCSPSESRDTALDLVRAVSESLVGIRVAGSEGSSGGGGRVPLPGTGPQAPRTVLVCFVHSGKPYVTGLVVWKNHSGRHGRSHVHTCTFVPAHPPDPSLSVAPSAFLTCRETLRLLVPGFWGEKLALRIPAPG